MGFGAITQYVDVAQLVLYAFWAFFFGLIYYLVRENHREGYPMETDGHARGVITGWPVPEPKTYRLAHGGEVSVPNDRRSPQTLNAEPTHGWIGAPLVPTGNPLTAGVGPGAWADRADEPDLDEHGHAKIVPLRAAADFSVAGPDIDPRGLPVIGADGEEAGRVTDLWVDRMEVMFRYLEVKLPGVERTVLVPVNFTRIGRDAVRVKAILSSQFAGVPPTRHPEQITLLEEEKITAYFGAGTLYAEPGRAEALL